MNPFTLKAYQSPAYFCDREEETQTMMDAALNGRDITLYALRRMGKTGLIYNVAYYLKKKHNYLFIFSDILSTDNENQLLEELANNIVQQAFPKRQWFDKAANLLKSLSPVISLDPITGMPEISVSAQDQKQVFSSFEQLFNLLESLNRPIYWAFDEFQQIQNYPDPLPVFKKLRTLVQRSKNIQFVFSGSQQGILHSIFEDSKAPFFKSTQLLHLSEIPKPKYEKFIASKFNKAKIPIEDGSLDYLLDRCLTHTWYVQMLCNRLYQIVQPITDKHIDATLSKILDEYEMTYYNYRSLLTGPQWSLLKAVALEVKVKKITASKFIKKYDLSSSASVLRSLTKLMKDEMIVEIIDKEDKYYRLNDVFLIRWMQRTYG